MAWDSLTVAMSNVVFGIVNGLRLNIRIGSDLKICCHLKVDAILFKRCLSRLFFVCKERLNHENGNEYWCARFDGVYRRKNLEVL